METDAFPDSPLKVELQSRAAFRIASVTERESSVLKAEF